MRYKFTMVEIWRFLSEGMTLSMFCCVTGFNSSLGKVNDEVSTCFFCHFRAPWDLCSVYLPTLKSIHQFSETELAFLSLAKVHIKSQSMAKKNDGGKNSLYDLLA